MVLDPGTVVRDFRDDLSSEVERSINIPLPFCPTDQ